MRRVPDRGNQGDIVAALGHAIGQVRGVLVHAEGSREKDESDAQP